MNLSTEFESDLCLTIFIRSFSQIASWSSIRYLTWTIRGVFTDSLAIAFGYCVEQMYNLYRLVIQVNAPNFADAAGKSLGNALEKMQHLHFLKIVIQVSPRKICREMGQEGYSAILQGICSILQLEHVEFN